MCCARCDLITVSAYPPCEIPERYLSVRDLRRACVLCRYRDSRRDLRQDKRYIVEQEKGGCRLHKDGAANCRSFRKIPELRGRNMSITEKLYARMYTRKFLRQVSQEYARMSVEKLSCAIHAFLREKRSRRGNSAAAPIPEHPSFPGGQFPEKPIRSDSFSRVPLRRRLSCSSPFSRRSLELSSR